MDVPEIVRRRAAAHGEVGLRWLRDGDPRSRARAGLGERVSTGLLLLQVGLEPLGREFLAVAEAWASQ